MKKINLVLIALLVTTMTYAQVENPHRIGFNIGGSSANGDYADDDSNNDDSGFAEGGVSILLSYQYTFNENIAVSVIYGSSANSFNAQGFADELARESPNINWRVEAEPYGVGYFLAGPKGIVGKKIKAYFNPLVGYGAMIVPEVKVEASLNNISVDQTFRETDPTGAFLIGGSVGAEFVVSELISINLDLLYLSGNFKDIEQELETFDSNGNPTISENTYSQNYSTTNFTVGIGFNF